MLFTDRKRYQRLTSSGKDKEVETALIRTLGAYSQSNSYCNIPDRDLELIASDTEPFIRFFGLATIMAKKLETGNYIPPDIQRKYDETAKLLPHANKTIMDRELDKYRKRFFNSYSTSLN